MTHQPIDPHAVRIPQGSGLSPCLYVPIAARDIGAIETYVGKILARLTPRSPSKALLVEAHEPEKPDHRRAIWSLAAAEVLHHPRQVWVSVDYSGYRRAYLRAFPDVDLTGLVLDHVLNRRVARLKGFKYLRIVSVSRAANSSHGTLLHGSDLGTDPPSPELGSGHSVAVGHPQQGHRIEDLACHLRLNSLSIEGSTSHTSTDDRLESVHGILHQATCAVA